MNSGVIAVHKSHNRKTGEVSATYAAQQTCPKACPLRGNGCYAESGNAYYVTKRLNASSASALSIARTEAKLIGALPGDRPLRVHNVGDCPTDATAQIVSTAMHHYATRSGEPAWTYTHAWRTVGRDSWGDASALASCETVAEVRQGRARGYATALVVNGSVPTDIRTVQCPAQTHGVTCADCRLCTQASRLYTNGITITFDVHGTGAKKAAAVLAERN